MARNQKTKRTCPNGHHYFKGSDCPTCPVCEEIRKPKDNFLSQLASPARRALEKNGINSLERLSTYSESELLSFHGIGPSSIPKLRKVLEEIGKKLKQ